MGKIFYIMGKSASGKDRIYSLLEDQRELKLKTLVYILPGQSETEKRTEKIIIL